MKLLFPGLIFLMMSFLVVNNAFAISSLKIRCNVEGATVSIDGKFKGESPSLDAEVRAGKHKIVIRKNLADGSYYYYEKEVRLGDGVTQEIFARLERKYTEEYYWNKAEKSGSVMEYEEYLKKCPNGTNVKKAMVKVEDLYYSFCSNISGCNKYLEKYPSGRYAKKSADTIEDLYFAKCDSISGCNEYLEEYPNGRYAKNTKNKIADLKKPKTPTVVLATFKNVGPCRWSPDKKLSELELTDVNISFIGCRGKRENIWFGDIQEVEKRQPGWPGFRNECAVTLYYHRRGDKNLHFRTEDKRDNFYHKLNAARESWVVKYQISTKQFEKTTDSVNSNKSILILGLWKNEVGMIEYFKEGTFMLNVDTGEKKAGTWNINGDTLTLRFYIYPKTYKYKILELSASTYKIMGISVDKNTYNARRIESTMQTVYTTERPKIQISKPKIKIDTNYGSFTLELYPKKAPKTVENFLQYVRDGFYKGTIFHRVIKGFIIQGGGLSENMRQKLARDPINNEGSNGLKNLRGTVAMARSNEPHSSTSQFFINTANNTSLDYKVKNAQDWGCCVFGKVVDGMDVISTIENLPTITEGEFNDVPVNQVIIESIKIDNNSQQSNSASTGNNKKSDVSNNVSSSVFATNTSNIYHKSNCPELGTKDLMEFNSPKKARKSGGIPCGNCNP